MSDESDLQILYIKEWSILDEGDFGSKEWIRENWDEELGTGPPPVVLMKFLREAPTLAIFPLTVTIAAGACFSSAGAPNFAVLTATSTVFAGYFALFFRRYECMTVTKDSSE